MADLATLELEVRRTSVEQATRALDALAQKGGMAGDMARRLKADFASGAISAEQLAAATAKLAPALGGTTPQVNRLTEAFRRMQMAARQSGADAMAAQIQRLDRFQQQATVSTGHAITGYARLERAFSTAGLAAAGLGGRASQLGSALLMFGTTGIVTASVVAGVAILGLAFRALTGPQRAFTEGLKAARDAADQLRQSLRATLFLQAELIQQEIEANRARLAHMPRVIPGEDIGGGAAAIVARLQQQIAADDMRVAALRNAAWEDTWRAIDEAAKRRQQGIEDELRGIRALQQAESERFLAAAKALRELEERRPRVMDPQAAEFRRMGLGGLISTIPIRNLRAGALAIPETFEQAWAKLEDDARATFLTIRTIGGQFFEELANRGLAAFDDLFDHIRQAYARLVADLAAQKLLEKLTLGKSGLGTAALAGLGGFAIGQANPGLGVLGGALGGLAVGGPVGAAVGALGGFIGGIVGAGQAAREAAERLRELREGLQTTFQALRADIAGQGLTRDLIQLSAQFAEVRKQIIAATPNVIAGFGGETRERFNAGITEERNRLLREAAELERMRADQLVRSNAALANSIEDFNNLRVQIFAQLPTRGWQWVFEALADLAKLEAAWKAERAAAITVQLQDLEVRRLRAVGLEDEAAILALGLAHQREYQDALEAGYDATQLMVLGEVQLAEMRQLQTAQLNRQIEEAQRQIDQLRGLSSGLREAAILAGGRIASPAVAVQDARQQFQEIAQLALGGDRAAAARLPALAEALLDASRAYNASGIAFVQEVRMVQDVLNQVAGRFEDEASLLQQQVDLLTQIRDRINNWPTQIVDPRRPEWPPLDPTGGTDTRRWVVRDPDVYAEMTTSVTVLTAGFTQLSEKLDVVAVKVEEMGAVVTRQLEGFQTQQRQVLL